MNGFFKGKPDYFRWKVIFTVSVASLFILESLKLTKRIELAEMLGNYSPVFTHSIILLIMVLSLAFMWKERKRAPFFLSFVIFYNFFNTNIIPAELIKSARFSAIDIIGMPEILFYLYLGLNVFIVIAMVTYYFTDYLFGDILRYKDAERNKVFEDYLTDVSKKWPQVAQASETDPEGLWRE